MADHPALLTFFRALADEERLRVAARLVAGQADAELIASELGLRRQDVQRHLALLVESGLVRSEDGRQYCWDTATVQQMKRAVLHRRDDLPEGTTGLDDERRKVLRAFIKGEQITSIPVDGRKKVIVLEWLLERFEYGRRYPEREVNDIIKRHHPDSATLRREFVDRGMMQRDAGIYWRPTPPD